MKLCLNMIVKNESARIVRALNSVAQFIDCYAITDTGSTDDTPKIIRDYFDAHRIKGVVTYAPFNDWSQARNAALIAARSIQPRHGWDWALLTDADMLLVMKDLPKFQAALADADARGGLSIDMEQRAGTLHYANRRLISKRAKGMYHGVTHEYLDVDTCGMITPAIAYFEDKADGANRTDKYKRDIALLLKGLESDPNNGRYFYYLAQSYRDAGDLDNAMHWYKKRVEFGGWEEERWSAQVNYAHCVKDKGDEAGFIRELLIAYNMRPSRAETLFDLATHFRHQDGKQNIAALFAEIGMTVPRTMDLLFVNDYVYTAGLKEEFAITGFYNEQKRGAAFAVCSDLSLQPGPYNNARETARTNLYWYIRPLGEYCPSFKWQALDFTPPADWVAMNPSVTEHLGSLVCNVRCVNYRINEHGQYLIRANDGTANNTNPINTRNFLVGLSPKDVWRVNWKTELLPPSDLPCEFKPVIGFEDTRLFSAGGKLWGSSTVRQIHWDGNCEQVLTQIDMRDAPKVVDWKRMLPAKRETEKNWSPICEREGDPLWVHRPGVTINDKGEFVHSNPPPLTTDIISGGSQLIRFGQFYLALVHTARQIPGSPCRYYYHRWAVYEPEKFHLVALSCPFVFHEKVIEFAAGLARHPAQPGTLVVSYGFKDNEARVATISEAEVARMIWSPYK